MTLRDSMGREVGGGFRIGNTSTPVADSCWRMAKPIQYCKVISLQLNKFKLKNNNNQFSSVPQSCPTLCDPMDYSMPGFNVHHQLLELAQTHVYWIGDAIQPSHPLSSPSPSTFNLAQYQGLFQCVSSLHLVAEVLKFQLQHQAFQWILRTDFL